MSDSQDSIVFLHGFTGSGNDWSIVSKHLSNEFSIKTPDIVGHGNSIIPANRDDYRMKNISETLLKLTDSSFHLVGYSMGGRLALYMATHYPEWVKSLTLISASPGLKTKAEREARRKSDNELADKIENNGIEWFVDFWGNLSLWDSQSSELKAQLRENRLKNFPVGLANSLRGMGTGIMPSLWDKLPDLAMPVKLIVGELDSKFMAINQEMVNLIPDADLSIIPGAGHANHLEKPDEFKNILLSFLNTHKTS